MRRTTLSRRSLMVLPVIRSATLLMLAAVTASPQNSPLKDQVESVFPDAQALYVDFHQHPELPSHETRTAALMASKLRSLGYEVTENIVCTGNTPMRKNSPRATGMSRTELDSMPGQEQNRMPHASQVRTKDDSGRDVGVMHACGH